MGCFLSVAQPSLSICRVSIFALEQMSLSRDGCGDSKRPAHVQLLLTLETTLYLTRKS